MDHSTLLPHWFTNRRESLVETLTRGLDEADVVVTSGGVSMGEKVHYMCVRDNHYVLYYTDMTIGLIEARFGD